MKRFAELVIRLDQTTKTNEKVQALAAYFEKAEEEDRLWTIAILSHKRPKRTVKISQLRSWSAEIAGLPDWLFEESYHVVGDLAETIGLLLPKAQNKNAEHSLSFWIRWIKDLNGQEDNYKKQAILKAWDQLDLMERFVFNKLITGGFRLGVSQKLMVRALSLQTRIEENTLMHRLMGDWTPDTVSYQQLVLSPDPRENISQPYPFFLAHPLEGAPAILGDHQEWQVEYKWDGIRGQIIKREGQIFVWSRGEELVTHQFPEFKILAGILPDGTVLDGEILPYKSGSPLPFQELQTRMGRKKVSSSLMEKTPIVFFAYDVLEWDGKDFRERSLQERRKVLEALVKSNFEQPSNPLRLSPSIDFEEWEDLVPLREKAREQGSEGLMLKRKNAPYLAGRKKGDWWKWKVDPLTIDAVMIYAQRGHGRRANLYTDYTFGVWEEDRLIPFAKAYSGLTDNEFKILTAWIRQNTLEQFGPVRSVRPYYVFEIAFEGIQLSNRHKSGVAVRFPRILRWRKDKKLTEANTLEDLKSLMNQT
jgi:DNA ligase-1